ADQRQTQTRQRERGRFRRPDRGREVVTQRHQRRGDVAVDLAAGRGLVRRGEEARRGGAELRGRGEVAQRQLPGRDRRPVVGERQVGQRRVVLRVQAVRGRPECGGAHAPVLRETRVGGRG